MGQLLLKNIVNIIERGSQDEKDAVALGLNSCASVSILVCYYMIYHIGKQKLIIHLLIQTIIVIHYEIAFYERSTISAQSAIIYMMQIQLYLQRHNGLFDYLSHCALIYAILRFLIREFTNLLISEILLMFLWQPLNHYLLYLHKSKKPQKKEDITTQVHFQTISSPQAQHTQGVDEIVTKTNMTEDFFDYIPEGLVILDEYFNIIKHNSKILQYLQIKEPSTIPQSLDSLLKIAQKNKVPMKDKDRKRPLHLKSMKQNSEMHFSYSGSLASSLKKQFWTSDRQQLNYSFQKGDSMMYPSLQAIINEFKVRNTNDNITINSESCCIVKYQINQESSIKYKYISIKIYEIKMPSNLKSTLFLFIVENITNKEQLKQLTNRFIFQQQLLNSFSHELRTPLNCTLSLLQALKSKLKNDEINNDYLNPAMVTSHRLLYQINDILDYAQIECQDFKLNICEFTVGDVFQTLKDFFIQECAQKKIQMIIEIDCLIVIRNDKERITQVLINLISNSIKFTPQGGRIVVNVKKRDNLYQFTVWDNGKGISNQTMSNIFEQQQNMILSTKVNDNQFYSNKLGIGLKVSRGIVKYLSTNGDLIIKSQSGCYTSINFFVEDKFMKIDEDISEETILRLASKNTLKKCVCPQILIVDDIPFNHIALIAILNSFNVTSESAYDGDQAIEKVSERIRNSQCCKSYRIIFMDLEMPGKNGFQTSSEIVTILKKVNAQSVIVMHSAYTGEENVEQGRLCGMKEFIPKPISLVTLQNLINKYFSQQA
ncbi:unnamed protein product (macronuclear) [Paramecium tetraurelia]|uniref:Response regulatory domain-containing protein n=1 Tax=Paramecium tetraurelia TaxID=5888 RepID=A0BQB8_PARTE|nr:uncharacterized protein GSPATT00030964001 [Paramecium tetraurelia]CAK60735.1 unnamed protein product [Paramecium tetraurelia]|eukprot:XP_001428133.1 hypothetical protein (macronuclear) [Paramecium tetraurelia strain d4-2]